MNDIFSILVTIIHNGTPELANACYDVTNSQCKVGRSATPYSPARYMLVTGI